MYIYKVKVRINLILLELLIEKRLGDNEVFYIKFNSLVAFSSTVFFNKANSYTQGTIEVSGPGLVIFEAGNTPKEHIRFDGYDKRNLVYLAILIILIFITTILEKKELINA